MFFFLLKFIYIVFTNLHLQHSLVALIYIVQIFGRVVNSQEWGHFGACAIACCSAWRERAGILPQEENMTENYFEVCK